MELYYFLSSEHALQAFENQELKVSRFDQLNDPFELMAGGSGERMVRNSIRRYKQSMTKKTRLLCCSKSWGDPLLWSHYGDKHKGAALVIQIPQDLSLIHISEPTRPLYSSYAVFCL